MEIGDPNKMGMEEKALFKVRQSLKLSDATANGEIPASVLLYKNQVMLPRAIRHRIITRCHRAGHLGIVKTYDQVAILYYWPLMFETIIEFINGCAQCLLERPTNLKGLVHHPLETVHEPHHGIL